MKPGRSWLFYSLIRVGLFAVVLALLLLLQFEPWIAAVAAALISLCVSYIFFRKPREDVARSLYEIRHAETKKVPYAPEREGSDEANEDALIDAREEGATDQRAPEKSTKPPLEGDGGSEAQTEQQPG